MKPLDGLQKKDLAQRWKCCLKTVDRRIKRLGLVPVTFTGNQPVFDQDQLLKAEDKDFKARVGLFKKRYSNGF